MQRLGHLKTLDISNNQLGNEGLRDLLPILRSLPNLEILNLSDNYITLLPIMQEELIEVFQGIRHLKTFHISGNTLNEQAITVLLPILHSLPNLEELNLSATRLNRDLLMNKGVLDTIRQSLKKLRKLIIKRNKISKDDIHLIREILPKVEIISE
jgi:Ran GTPase-activating protein (RanGAP) involved in mRNA processing and transport